MQKTSDCVLVCRFRQLVCSVWPCTRQRLHSTAARTAAMRRHTSSSSWPGTCPLAPQRRSPSTAPPPPPQRQGATENREKCSYTRSKTGYCITPPVHCITPPVHCITSLTCCITDRAVVINEVCVESTAASNSTCSISPWRAGLGRDW